MVLEVSHAQNVCLDFDGEDDYLSTNLPLQNNDFTTEMWFLSADIFFTGTYRNLMALKGENSQLKIGITDGLLSISWEDADGNTQTDTPISNFLFFLDWHHIVLVRTSEVIEVYIDCELTWTGQLEADFDFTDFYIGHLPDDVNSGYWLGQIDDVRVWNFPKTLEQIKTEKRCILTGEETGLWLYWNFDEGTAGGNNEEVSVEHDISSNGHNGIFSGFLLDGDGSNYVTSQARMAYPNLRDLTIDIRDYPYQTASLTEICNGDPAHFRLLKDGVAPAPYSNVNVKWYYDDGQGAIALTDPPFSDFKFGVPQGTITYDCLNSTDGFVDRTYFAISEVSVDGVVCEYESEAYNLRICCPIRPATVQISPSAPLCEGETVTVDVSLNSPDPFVQTPGEEVDIEWFYNGTALNLSNQTSFTYTLTTPTVAVPEQICFEAVVSNCNGKTGTFQSCLTVDPEPVCGQLIGWPDLNPMNLTLVSTSPHLIYEICPGNDAIVGINPDFPFMDCIPQWQYSFDFFNWYPLGFSNTVQNTNILPTAEWTNSSIYYNIKCNPLSSPSGCEPCWSDLLEIRLKSQPIPNSITGENEVCLGTTNTLSVSSFNANHNYTWYCDGLVVGTGPDFSYEAEKSACYWVETSDGCYIVESQRFCVEVCEIIPILSCPLPPNDCACINEAITLSACDSYSTCEGRELQYTWYINEVLQSNTGCTITDTPPASGAVYRVEVLDTATNCLVSTRRTVVPCDKNN